ncbi:hypothetical protein DASC09_040300 [Saccharomycopsis crataegensis]|uniref:Uncharacterized protein n=1 Tax=Saccharomycopsis crataegensis TaxID=43959 RepID=A0AAV5QQ99_9ASCO|nr:hypothetical protein DASC09_040300 [Saccharomycopsis crataegensis]
MKLQTASITLTTYTLLASRVTYGFPVDSSQTVLIKRFDQDYNSTSIIEKFKDRLSSFWKDHSDLGVSAIAGAALAQAAGYSNSSSLSIPGVVPTGTNDDIIATTSFDASDSTDTTIANDYDSTDDDDSNSDGYKITATTSEAITGSDSTDQAYLSSS